MWSLHKQLVLKYAEFGLEPFSEFEFTYSSVLVSFLLICYISESKLAILC